MKIDVRLFSNRPSSLNAIQAIMGAIGNAQAAGIRAQMRALTGSLIHAARNRALALMAPDADYLLMVDDDMLPEPQAIVKLAAHGASVASALCTTRVPPVELCIKVWNPQRKCFVMMDDMRRDRAVTGPFAAGAGFLMLSRQVVETLIEHHLSARDWVASEAARHERMEVSRARVEKERARISAIRRALFESDKQLRIFDFPVTDDEVQLGEDIGMSLRLVEIGTLVTVDPTVKVGHLGEYPFSPDDYQPQNQKQMEAAA